MPGNTSQLLQFAFLMNVFCCSRYLYSILYLSKGNSLFCFAVYLKC